MNNNYAQCLLLIFVLMISLLACSNDQEEQVELKDIGVINFYFESGRYFDVLAEAETLAPEALNDPELRFIIAKTYLNIGYPDRAQEIMENLKLENYESNDIDLFLVEALFKQQKINQAQKLLLSTELQSKHASNPAAMLLRAKLELADSNIDLSKEILHNILPDSNEYAGAQVWLARIDLLQNAELKAIRRLESLLEENIEFADAWLLLANIKFSNEEYTDAEDYYLQALRLDKSKILTQQSLRVAQNIVLSKTAIGNSVGAQEFYRTFLESYPKSPIYYFELARLAYEKSDFPKAEENLKEVLKSSENNLKVIFLLAKILTKQGKLKDASIFIQQYLDREIGGIELVIFQAIINTKMNNYKSAVEILSNHMLKNEEDKSIVMPLMAYAYLKSENMVEYKKLIQSYSNKSGEILEGINIARAIYIDLDEYTDAEDLVHHFVSKFPKSNELKIIYLSTLHDIGKQKDITIKLNEWLSNQPDNNTLRLISINQEIENENYASAVEQFNNLDASNISTREEGLLVNNIKNLVVRSSGKYEQSNITGLLVNWHQRLPENKQLALILADSYITSNNYKSAIPIYLTILQQHPNDYVILNNLAWSYFSIGDERALQTAERAYASNPNDAPVCDTLGWILVNSGQVEQGLQLLTRALEIDPDNKDIQAHYNIAMKKLN